MIIKAALVSLNLRSFHDKPTVVKVLPRELRCYISSRIHGLHSFYDLQVWYVNVFMFWRIVILFGHHNTGLEEILVYLLPIFFWYQHDCDIKTVSGV